MRNFEPSCADVERFLFHPMNQVCGQMCCQCHLGPLCKTFKKPRVLKQSVPRTFHGFTSPELKLDTLCQTGTYTILYAYTCIPKSVRCDTYNKTTLNPFRANWVWEIANQARKPISHRDFWPPPFQAPPENATNTVKNKEKHCNVWAMCFRKQHFPTENMDTKIPKKLGVGKLWFQSFSAFCNSTCALCCFWITCQAGIGRDRYSENCGAGEAGRGRGTGALGLGHTVDGRNPAPVDIVFRYQLDRYMTCVYVCSCIFVFTNIYIYIYRCMI